MPRKKHIFDARPSRHDDLVAELIANLDQVKAQCGWAQDGPRKGIPGLHVPPSVVVEQKCGRGYLDLCISWKVAICNKDCELYVRRYPYALRRRGIIVEVKSELETWSAGDVIRQLKGYQENFDGEQRTCLNNFCNLLTPEKRSTMALFSGRSLSAAEVMLLKHEHVSIIKPSWRPVATTGSDGCSPT